jgi:hypothetical protein
VGAVRYSPHSKEPSTCDRIALQVSSASLLYCDAAGLAAAGAMVSAVRSVFVERMTSAGSAVGSGVSIGKAVCSHSWPETMRTIPLLLSGSSVNPIYP